MLPFQRASAPSSAMMRVSDERIDTRRLCTCHRHHLSVSMGVRKRVCTLPHYVFVRCTWNRILTRSRGATQVFARHPATPPASNDLHTSESITAPPVCGMGAAAGPPALARRSSTIPPLWETQVAAICAQACPLSFSCSSLTVFLCKMHKAPTARLRGKSRLGKGMTKVHTKAQVSSKG
jgi:hypothetical protein